MRKKLLVLFVLSFTVITACSQVESSLEGKVSQLEEDKAKLTKKLTDKENKIENLTQKIARLENEIEEFNKEKENIPMIVNLSREFVQAHTSGDKEKLRQLLSDKVILEDRGDKLYAIIDEAEWQLFFDKRKVQFDDWKIQGYGFNSEDNTINIFIREFYLDLNGKPSSPPTFLILTFEKFNDEWKIVNLGFDV